MISRAARSGSNVNLSLMAVVGLMLSGLGGLGIWADGAAESISGGALQDSASVAGGFILLAA